MNEKDMVKLLFMLKENKEKEDKILKELSEINSEFRDKINHLIFFLEHE